MAFVTKSLLGAASILALVSSAYAADVVEPEAPAPAPVAGFNWSGFYVGVGGGFGASNHRVNAEASNGSQSQGLGSFNGIGGDGVFGEITAGYDHMLTDRLLLGGFIDAQLSNIGPSLDVNVGPRGDNLLNADLTNQYGFDVGARIGYLLNPSTLGYVLGGYSWRHFKLDGSFEDESFKFTKDRGGYVIGVGMETVVGSNWTIKTEYRYADYGNPTVFSTDIGDAALGLKLNPSTHTFHIAANYRFGAQDGGGAAIAAPEYNWSGFYVGGALGAGEVVHDLSLNLPPLADVSLKGIGSEGMFGEGSVGYDHDFGSWVGGIMLDARYSGIESKLDLDTIAGVTGKVKADYGFDVLGRIGMKVNESTLAYVLGGYSWQHFKASISSRTDSESIDWNSSGFSVGGGLETAVSTNATVGLEYRYSRYAKEDFDTDGLLNVRPTSHTVRLGLKYKFN